MVCLNEVWPRNEVYVSIMEAMSDPPRSTLAVSQTTTFHTPLSDLFSSTGKIIARTNYPAAHHNLVGCLLMTSNHIGAKAPRVKNALHQNLMLPRSAQGLLSSLLLTHKLTSFKYCSPIQQIWLNLLMFYKG